MHTEVTSTRLSVSPAPEIGSTLMVRSSFSSVSLACAALLAAAAVANRVAPDQPERRELLAHL